MRTPNPFDNIITTQGYVVLDGGLATELERRGHRLRTRLWSGEALLGDPKAIYEIHMAFLQAGADCITTSSYQTSVQGLGAAGFDAPQVTELLNTSVTVALEARRAFWDNPNNRRHRPRPLVAASVGPYGAYLADGSEYRGGYGVSVAHLVDFHRPQIAFYSNQPVDLIACETIPSVEEIQALSTLLTSGDKWAWVSLSIHDGMTLADGTPLCDAVALLDAVKSVAAIGLNCCAPELVSESLSTIVDRTTKPVIVYPNAGGSYDPHSKEWTHHDGHTIADLAATWHGLGASIIGGCCGVSPTNIAATRAQLQNPRNIPQ